MKDKKYLSELLTDEDITKNPVTCIVAGLGSGKSSWVEGIHTTHEEVKGLVDRYKALYMTSRRSKVDESHQNNPALLKSIDSFFEHKETLGQAESVGCTFSHVVEYIKRSRITNPWFWREFDYIVVDECHSIATDSTFTESSVIYDFLLAVYEDCIKDKEAAAIRTRIILMTATPSPIPTLLYNLNTHIIDLSTQTRWIKPLTMNILPFYGIADDIKVELEWGGRVVYYSTFFDKYEELIELATSVGITQSQIIIDVSNEKKQREIKEKYPIIYAKTEDFRNNLSRSKVIDENIKLVITNSKNKEGININSEVDLLVVENHYYTDIKQICGRFRLGVPVALIVDDARQFDLNDSYTEEYRLACGMVESYNYYIQPFRSRIENNDEQIIGEIEKLLKHSKHIAFNWFKYCFEINECYSDCQADYFASLSNYENRMTADCGWMDIGDSDPYFEELIGYAHTREELPQRTMEEEFTFCCIVCNYSLGSVINYYELNNFSRMLNTLYKKRHKGKTFDKVSCLLKKYGYKARPIGKHTLKEEQLYCIEKVA